MTDKRIGIIGAGNMGAAIAQGIVKAGLFKPGEVVVTDVIAAKADALARDLGAETAPSGSAVAHAVSMVLIAVKPQTMEKCLSELNGVVGPSHLILSIAAGITTGFIQSRLGGNIRVVRVMPNTPALVGVGASAICPGAHATEADMDEAEKIFAALGKVYRLDESLIDAVTAVSGSGPAYLFLFAECLEQAALSIGLPASDVPDLVAQTLFGAAKLLIESGESTSELRAKVTSPGGTTEAAIAVLKDRGFGEIMGAAVTAALDRARELGGEKKN